MDGKMKEEDSLQELQCNYISPVPQVLEVFQKNRTRQVVAPQISLS